MCVCACLFYVEPQSRFWGSPCRAFGIHAAVQQYQLPTRRSRAGGGEFCYVLHKCAEKCLPFLRRNTESILQIRPAGPAHIPSRIITSTTIIMAAACPRRPSKIIFAKVPHIHVSEGKCSAAFDG